MSIDLDLEISLESGSILTVSGKELTAAECAEFFLLLAHDEEEDE